MSSMLKQMFVYASDLYVILMFFGNFTERICSFSSTIPIIPEYLSMTFGSAK